LITRRVTGPEQSQPTGGLEREVCVCNGWRQFVRQRVYDVSTVALEQA
jgi:hypothetical protein